MDRSKFIDLFLFQNKTLFQEIVYKRSKKEKKIKQTCNVRRYFNNNIGINQNKKNILLENVIYDFCFVNELTFLCEWKIPQLIIKITKAETCENIYIYIYANKRFLQKEILNIVLKKGI